MVFVELTVLRRIRPSWTFQKSEYIDLGGFVTRAASVCSRRRQQYCNINDENRQETTSTPGAAALFSLPLSGVTGQWHHTVGRRRTCLRAEQLFIEQQQRLACHGRANVVIVLSDGSSRRIVVVVSLFSLFAFSIRRQYRASRPLDRPLLPLPPHPRYPGPAIYNLFHSRYLVAGSHNVAVVPS